MTQEGFIILAAVAWNDAVGALGVLAILGSYLLLLLGRLRQESIAYSAINAVGAGLIALSLLVDFNAWALTVEVAWFAISLVGIARAWRAKRGTNSQAGNSGTTR
ncbi:MAG: hypothetical protein KDD65_03470 [Bacteroidetes bacterium]|nr:hypothetical protein [Bacteroidota bacterium]